MRVFPLQLKAYSLPALFSVLAYALFTVAYFYIPHLHRELIVEDRSGEYLQFFIYAATAVILLARAQASFWARGVALAFALLALEEISWGTRLLGWQWKWLESKSLQGSADFHNILPLTGNTLVYTVFFLVFALLAPLVERSLQKQGKGPASSFFSRPTLYVPLLISLLVTELAKGTQMIFIYEFSETVIAFAFFWTLGSYLGIQRRKLLAITLCLAMCSLFFSLMGWGDSTLLNYGGAEWGVSQ